jgi:hypothetical protein
MPVRRRVDKRKQAVTDQHEAWLQGDDKASGFIKYAPSDELAALWATRSERIVAEHVALYPGTRPARWWQYSAPRIPVGTSPGMWYDGLLPAPLEVLSWFADNLGHPMASKVLLRTRSRHSWNADWRVAHGLQGCCDR